MTPHHYEQTELGEALGLPPIPCNEDGSTDWQAFAADWLDDASASQEAQP